MRLLLTVLMLASATLLRATPITDRSVWEADTTCSLNSAVFNNVTTYADNSTSTWDFASRKYSNSNNDAAEARQWLATVFADDANNFSSFLGLFFANNWSVKDLRGNLNDWLANRDCPVVVGPDCPVETVPDSTSMAFLLAVTAVGLALVKKLAPGDRLG